MPISFVLAAAAVLSGCGASAGADDTITPAPSLQRFEYHAIKLGSNYNLVLYAPNKPAADAAAKAAEAEIDRLEAVFSDYKADSEVSRLSRLTRDKPMNEPVAISRDLYNVLALSQSMAERTGGAFDVTVGPYIQLWRRSRRQQELPSPERLAEAKQSVGWRKLKLFEAVDHDRNTLGAQLLAADMRLDLGAVATGYMSDRVLAVLEAHGIASAICDLSGDLAIGDPPPGKAGWRIAIQSLTAPDEVAEFLELSNCGVSTSGDTYRFVVIDNVRYSHIVDSQSGLGLKTRIGVTVVAPDGVTADVLATTISVLGARNGMALADADTAVRIVSENEGKYETTTSASYQRLTKAAAATD